MKKLLLVGLGTLFPFSIRSMQKSAPRKAGVSAKQNVPQKVVVPTKKTAPREVVESIENIAPREIVQALSALKRLNRNLYILKWAYSPDETKLVTLSDKGKIVIWDVAALTSTDKTVVKNPRIDKTTVKHPRKIHSLEFNKQGTAVLIDGEEYPFVSATALTKIKTVGKAPKFMIKVQSADKKIIAGVSVEGVLSVWNAQTGRPIATSLVKGLKDVEGIDIAPDNSKITVHTKKGSKRYDIAESDELREAFSRIRNKGDAPKFVKYFYNQDTNMIVGVDKTGTVSLWNTETGRVIDPSITTLRNEIEALDITPDGKKVLIRTEQGVDSYDVIDPRLLIFIETNAFWKTSQGTKKRMITKNLSHDRTKLAILDSEGTISLWNAKTGELLVKSLGVYPTAQHLSFSGDDKNVIVDKKTALPVKA